MTSGTARDKEKRSQQFAPRSVRNKGYLLRISRFWALGFAVSDFPVHVFDLPDGFGIDGLVGLSFLRQFNIELKMAEGRMMVDRIDET